MNTRVKTAAEGLIEAIDKAVVVNYRRSGKPWPGSEDWDLDRLGGLGVYFPASSDWCWPFYNQEALSTFGQTAWDDFIQAWYSEEVEPSLPDELCDEECLIAPTGLSLTLEGVRKRCQSVKWST